MLISRQSMNNVCWQLQIHRALLLSAKKQSTEEKVGGFKNINKVPFLWNLSTS